MHNGMFVFDNVIHMYDQRPENVKGDRDSQVVNARYAAMLTGTQSAMATSRIPFNLNWANSTLSVEDAGRLLFEESDTDMAIAQTVPFFSYWSKGFAPVGLNHALAARHPDRVLLCGGVDPVWQGLDVALSEMDRQVKELGAVTFKYYNAQYDRSWRCDDRAVAYPMYEKAQELGINHIQFHKGNPFGFESVEDLAPNDLQAAARDFPDLIFVIHHIGQPYYEETINIAARFPNVWLGLSGFFLYPSSPYRTYHILGRALQLVGPERIMYGSEAFAWLDVQAIVESFGSLQIPEELQDNWGYPPITDDMRRLMFGENQARLLGIDTAQKYAELQGTTKAPRSA